MSDPTAFVRLEGVVKRFRAVEGAGPSSDAPSQPPVLRGIDLVIAERDSVAILGPSGSGKSTLLNCIGSLEPPTEGRVWFEGRDLATLDEEELARHRSHALGFVFQRHHLLPQCNALENVLLPTLADDDGPSPSEATERALALLDRVGLKARAHHFPSQLSGGECQRVAVVRALIRSPRLILADEPTGSLDATTAEALVDLLLELRADEGFALVMVTHARPLAERMERVLELRDGLLHELDSAERVG